MARRKQGGGITSVTLPVSVKDTSSTTGGGLSGLTSATSGLVCEYRRQGQSAWTTVTLSSGTLGTWSSGGFVADGSQAGDYELGLPDAAVASGARWVIVRLRGATNMLPVRVEIELDSVNYQSATAFITGVNALAPPTNWNLDSIDSSGRRLLQPTQAGVTIPTVTSLTNAPADSAGVGTLLTRVPNTLPSFPTNFAAFSLDASGRVTVISNADKTGYTASTVSDKSGYSLTTAEHTAISGTDVPAALTAQGYTTTRAGYLDTLNGLVAAIWASVSRTLTAISDSSGVTTLLSRLTAGRATGLDNLDTNVNSRMATFTYTAPANPTDYARNNVAPSWWVSPDNADVATALSDLVSLLARTDPTTALGTLQTAATAIRAKTDLLTFTGSNVNAAISGDATTTLYGDAGAIDWTYTVYDVDGTTPLPGTSVQVSADSAGTHRSQAKLTDSLGRVHFSLDAGTVYVFRSRPDRTFSDPDTEVVGL